jgi:hypothetical protein
MRIGNQQLETLVAWWVATSPYSLWERHRFSGRRYERVRATQGRARAMVAHDRVMNIEQTMKRSAP